MPDNGRFEPLLNEFRHVGLLLKAISTLKPRTVESSGKGLGFCRWRRNVPATAARRVQSAKGIGLTLLQSRRRQV